MDSTRRNFLQLSAGAAALTLGALGFDEVVEAAAPLDIRAQNPKVRAVEDALVKARPVPLANVRLTGGPLKAAQDASAKYLLSLDPDRMMAFYRTVAGLEKKAEPYGGWDGAGRQLTGHIAGHHLSGVSLMYLATGDVRFKDRATYLVSEMKVVQDTQGDGYLGALSGTLQGKPISGRDAFGMLPKGDIRSGGFDLNGMWSPWYVLHKTFAGLRDAYRHTGNATALQIEVKFATWAEQLLKPMTEEQFQKMLLTEHGGMNEVLADLYADTGDKRWLDLSLRFEHHAFTDALKRHQDNLDGKHGNCQIPKLCGSAARYGYTGDVQDMMAASFFWDSVVQHHTFATGGHGLAEYFGPPDQLSKIVDGRTCESCNVYNMLKLTRRLFSLRPDAFYADFHERALFNHVLASIDPADGAVCYMVPVGRGVQQEYQNMQTSFTCCVGSGMESHALHGDGLYYESDDTLWVNIFAPSTAKLDRIGGSVTMDTSFPDGGTAKLTLTLPAAKKFTLAVRRPAWAGDGFAVTVNGEAIPQPAIATLLARGAGGRNTSSNDSVPPASHVEITRTWKSGDVVELALPKTVRLESTPDDKKVAAIMWGPLVLAGDHGARQGGRGGGGAAAPAAPIPVLVAEKPVTDWVSLNGSGDFIAKQVARVPADPQAIGDLALVPFYRLHKHRYSVYFDVLTAADFDARAGAIAAERERVRKLEAATTGFVQPGEMQPERDFNYQSDPADRPVSRANGQTGRAFRGGAGWFSFDMPVDPSAAMAVIVTYQRQGGGQQNPTTAGPVNFQILVDGASIARYEQSVNADGFYDAQYVVPANLTRGKQKVTVKFQAADGSRVAPVFGVRMARADQLR